MGVKRPKIKGKGFRPWTEEHCAKYEGTHPLGTRARLAYELLFCTALRRSDIVRIGRQHIRALAQPVLVGPYKVTHELDLGQQKTDEDVGGLLILPQLQAAIDALPADNLTFIVTKDGKGEPLSPSRQCLQAANDKRASWVDNNRIERGAQT